MKEEVRRTSENSIDVAGSTPFLMRQDITPNLLLLSLDQLDVRQHTVSLVSLRQFSCAQKSLAFAR